MNSKIYYGNIQPNDKEFKVWVNDEGVIKTWDGSKWSEQSGNEGSTDNVEYTCVIYTNYDNISMILGNVDFSKIQPGTKVLIADNIDNTTKIKTFVSCNVGGTSYIAIYNIWFEESYFIDILDSSNIKTPNQLNGWGNY